MVWHRNIYIHVGLYIGEKYICYFIFSYIYTHRHLQKIGSIYVLPAGLLYFIICEFIWNNK